VRRRSYSSPDAIPADLHGQRRAQGGARREASDRVTIRLGGREFDGWTLNVSRGGARVVVEEQVEPGVELDVVIGDEAPRRARVVWVQDEADGQIAGFQFLDGSGSEPPPPGVG
jgi:hypothetical protein